MLGSTASLVASLLLGWMPASVPSVAAAAATCDGQPATVIGAPGQDRLAGTDGPDVIVSNGARTVDAGKGADLVCLTGGDATAVLDGPTEYDDTGTWATDRLIGSDGDDQILSGGGAYDFFDIDQDRENDDEFSLGTGDSSISIDGIPVGELHGGTGRDKLYLNSGSARVDVHAAQFLQFDTYAPTPLDGIESFHFESGQFSTVDFTGTSAAESVYTAQGPDSFRWGSSATTVNAQLGGGDDILSLGPRTKGTILGGTGRDEFRYFTTSGDEERVSVTMSNGVIRDNKLKATTSSFEKLYVNFHDAEVQGDRRANHIEILACTLRVRAGAGADRVLAVSQPRRTGPPNSPGRCDLQSHVVHGGLGNDRLVGTRYRDDLRGGPGRDFVDGRASSDRCVAERRVRCEG